MTDQKTNHTCTMEELAGVLVRHFGITTGCWGVYVEFAIGGVNVQDPQKGLMPAAMVPIVKIGIQPFPKGTPSTVTAGSLPQNSEAPSTP